MRAREFIITVDVDDMGEPNINVQPMHQPQPVAKKSPCQRDQLDAEPLEPEYDISNDPDAPDADDADDAWAYPQQQEIELKKAELGKRSTIAAQLVDDPEDDEIA
jgi:hypothetical protein